VDVSRLSGYVPVFRFACEGGEAVPCLRLVLSNGRGHRQYKDAEIRNERLQQTGTQSAMAPKSSPTEQSDSKLASSDQELPKHQWQAL
jgi:hypothetical protein